MLNKERKGLRHTKADRPTIRGRRMSATPGSQEREKNNLGGCSLVGKVARWRTGGHGCNSYIPQWHLRDKYVVSNKEVRKLGLELKTQCS